MPDAPALACLARCNILSGAEKGHRGPRIEGGGDEGGKGVACQTAYFPLAESPTGRFLTN